MSSKKSQRPKIALDNNHTDSYKNLITDLRAVFDSSYDVIYVSDARGITLRVSSACERLWGVKTEYLIGRSVYDLEKEGIFRPSVTRLVLEKKKKVQAIQETKTGIKLLVVGTPIINHNGEIVRVVNFSRDISLEKTLENELKQVKDLLEGYKHELKQLRRKTSINHNFVIKSKAMEKIFVLADKASEVDSAILISGESGVGKEIIANYIHQQSGRAEKPFIKVNCGAIPETLLEAEMFGYEKGAFTGASKDGKKGMFELANNGSLLLDEIGELLPSLQVKLLRVIQENELIRLGGNKTIKIDTRIIAATSRNLIERMEDKQFREDLYYRLNVIPIHVPSLRDRKEDILPLTLFFVDKFNKRYKKNKQLICQGLMEIFEKYYWPGNVRELKNIVERILVLSEDDVINADDLPDYMLSDRKHLDPIEVTDIIPLKQAIHLTEKKLLILARKKYVTTTKMAKFLCVNQSTISRKMSNRGIK